MDWTSVTVEPTEAAVVAQVSLHQVQLAIDEHMLPDALVRSGSNGRELLPAACVFISFYVGTSHDLTTTMQKWIIGQATRTDPSLPLWETLRLRDQPHFLISSGAVTVDLAPFAERAFEGWKALEDLRHFADVDPGVLAGTTAVIRGTRIPVDDVISALRRSSPAEILHDFPSLNARHLELARRYAEAYPNSRSALTLGHSRSEPVQRLRARRTTA